LIRTIWAEICGSKSCFTATSVALNTCLRRKVGVKNNWDYTHTASWKFQIDQFKTMFRTIFPFFFERRLYCKYFLT
jgi:hypothetical protein